MTKPVYEDGGITGQLTPTPRTKRPRITQSLPQEREDVQCQIDRARNGVWIWVIVAGFNLAWFVLLLVNLSGG
jgi:hypothetical protein